ncbi:MAG: GMP synthase (glutamine-hydrolyzing) subunit B [Methanomassiliicoccales archaeon PtaB.Bin134]|jgi:GMP synthase (glutamine-hydrolysing)|nr:MAG: GMP synthase (glutamine-hydrolyzing) subunit B [Methanomassiliicoccales archaeon PtaB.Bin134]
MFDPKEFVDEKIEELRNKITGRAVIACSGGVDSTVAAVLVDRAIGERLLTVYVDTGLMRKGETEYVRRMFDKLKVHYRIVDAKDEFFGALKGQIDPEKKRKAIGERFIRVFEREAQSFGADFLVQGTIAPDWIESGDGVRDTIKSHHNVGGLPKDMTLKLVEPLWDLYKDEVRAVARHLGVEVSERQPFPGPALAIRVIGEASPESVGVVREACAIVEEELEAAADKNQMVRPWQYFAVLLPVQSVGVQGDRRAYGRTVAIRSVESVDAMTASFSKVPYDVLERISLRITNEMKANINRVVYDITHKPPGTIEWE